MGGAKSAMMEEEANIRSVLQRLVDNKAVTECEAHGDFVDNFDPGAVEEVTEELAEEVGRERAVVLVEAALAQAGEECSSCGKNREG